MTAAGSARDSKSGLRAWISNHRRLTAAGVVLALWAIGSTSSAEESTDASARGRGAKAATSQHSDEPVASGRRVTAARDGDSDPGRGSSSHRRGTDRPRSGAGRKPAAEPKPTPTPVAPRTYLVTRIIDGDTLELGTGDDVRLVGIDTPEVGECGFEKASANLSYLTLGRQVTLTRSDEDRDRYGRLLRYVNVGQLDAGLRLIQNGLAIARYDSRDGYGFHPREPRYIAADQANPNIRCAAPQPLVAAPAQGGACAPGYTPCLPAFPPDVNCDDVDGPITVTGSDPHGLDADGDGVACE